MPAGYLRSTRKAVLIGRQVYFIEAVSEIGSSGHYTDYFWRRAIVIAEDGVKASVAYQQGDGAGIRCLEADKLFDERALDNPYKAAELMPDLIVKQNEGRLPY